MINQIPKPLIPYILVPSLNWFKDQFDGWTYAVQRLVADKQNLSNLEFDFDFTEFNYSDVQGMIEEFYTAADLNELSVVCGITAMQDKLTNQKDLSNYFFLHMHLLAHGLFNDIFSEDYNLVNIRDKCIYEQSALYFAAIMTHYFLQITFLSSNSAKEILGSMSDIIYLQDKKLIDDISVDVWNATIHICIEFFSLPILKH